MTTTVLICSWRLWSRRGLGIVWQRRRPDIFNKKDIWKKYFCRWHSLNIFLPMKSFFNFRLESSFNCGSVLSLMAWESKAIIPRRVVRANYVYMHEGLALNDLQINVIALRCDEYLNERSYTMLFIAHIIKAFEN